MTIYSFLDDGSEFIEIGSFAFFIEFYLEHQVVYCLVIGRK